MIVKSSTKSKNQLLYIEFEEAAIEAYNESLLSIQNFNTNFNFYRLNLELYNFKFFHRFFLSFINNFNSNGRMRREKVKGGFSYSSNSLTNAIF